jgi:hypothetical protein
VSVVLIIEDNEDNRDVFERFLIIAVTPSLRRAMARPASTR